MVVITDEIRVDTGGHGDTRDITADAASVVQRSGLANGVLTLFCPGSTGSVTTIEFEPGVVADLNRLFDEIVSPDREYKHHLAWNDDNGHSHVRAGLLGPSLAVPFVSGALTLGTWQQIVFVDFDTRGRERRLVAQVMGE